MEQHLVEVNGYIYANMDFLFFKVMHYQKLLSQQVAFED